MSGVAMVPDEDLATILKSRFQELMESDIYMGAIKAALGVRTAPEALELVRGMASNGL